jgi:hypothetical protein
MSLRSLIGVGLVALLSALPLAAQVEVGGFNVRMNGDINAGYTGDLSGLGGSDHGLGFGGNGTLSGFYYNPNFISFTVNPYYDRSQNNSTASSITDSSGYVANANIFEGSHFPGFVSFNQTWNSSGTFGIPGVTGLTTVNNNHGFAMGWSELVPGLPSLTASFSDSSGASSLLGNSAETDSTQRTFTVRSGYRLRGFDLNAGFLHLTTDVTSPTFVEGGLAENSSGSSNTFQFFVGHSLPLHGHIQGNYTRTDYNNNFSSGGSNGTSNSVDVYGSVVLGPLPVTTSLDYTDNLYGSFEQSLLSNGQPLISTFLTPVSRSFNLNVSTSYTLFNQVRVSGFVARQEQYITGQSFGVTQYGMNANYNFARHLLKGLTVTAGVVDSASKYGNGRVGLIGNLSYVRNFGGWEFQGNYGYNQTTQTMLAVYTTSSMLYTANVRHKLGQRLYWNIGAGGGKSGFEQQAGSGSRSEGFNTNLSWRGITAAANYSESNGTSVLTPTGLVAVPLPIVSANDLVVFNGRSWGYSLGATPVRRMVITGSYSRAISATLGESLVSNNQTELVTSQLRYQFRKMYFYSGVTWTRQSVSSLNTPPVDLRSYFFGISRWLSIF